MTSDVAFTVPSGRARPLVWLLTEQRTGDNNQLMALADALGWPTETKPIKYNGLRRIPFLRRGLIIVDRQSRASVRPPWPDLVICVGYTSVPLARFIRNQTKGRAKLVHIGNPRGPLDDFDLQITTPQYPRAPRPNLLELPFPIGNPARTVQPSAEELAWLAAYPRPRRLVAVGGSARFWELDSKALNEAIEQIAAKRPTGSLLIASSGRTKSSTREELERLARVRNAAAVKDFPRFATLLREADEIYVTADSVSMISEAAMSGKPVGLIPIRRTGAGRVVEALFERPTGKAVLPDFRNFWAMLDRARLMGTVTEPVAADTADTIEDAARAVRSLFLLGQLAPMEASDR